MANGLVIYYSRSGNTKTMAQTVAQAMEQAGLPTQCKSVDNVNIEDLLKADAIAVGTPTYYGQAASQIGEMFDASVSKHGSLDGKIGAAFSSSGNIGGGNETAICDILHRMLIHGMIIQGDPRGDHYGPVAIGKPDTRALEQCTRRGQRIAELANKLFG